MASAYTYIAEPRPDKRVGKRVGKAAGLAATMLAVAGCAPGPRISDAATAFSSFDGGLGFFPVYEVAAPTCKEVKQVLPYNLRPADVLILFDRSGSMNTAFGHGTRYSVETEILDDLLPVYDDKIRFGYQQFPGLRACPVGYVASCCSDRPSVAVAFGTSSAISDAMDDAAPVDGNTPTAEALRFAREYYQSLEDDVPDRYVLLATDGRPSCTSAGRLVEGDGADTVGLLGSRACTDALAEVDGLAARGVKVIVLGVGPGLASDPGGKPSCLDELARRGGIPRSETSPAFFTGEDARRLEVALQQIFGGVSRPSCLVELKAAPGDPSRVGVFLDGKEVPRNGVDGWGYDAPADFRKIRFFGDSCRRLDRFQATTIEVRFGCAPCTDAVNCE